MLSATAQKIMKIMKIMKIFTFRNKVELNK